MSRARAGGLPDHTVAEVSATRSNKANTYASSAAGAAETGETPIYYISLPALGSYASCDALASQYTLNLLKLYKHLREHPEALKVATTFAATFSQQDNLLLPKLVLAIQDAQLEKIPSLAAFNCSSSFYVEISSMVKIHEVHLWFGDYLRWRRDRNALSHKRTQPMMAGATSMKAECIPYDGRQQIMKLYDDAIRLSPKELVLNLPTIDSFETHHTQHKCSKRSPSEVSLLLFGNASRRTKMHEKKPELFIPCITI